MHMKRIKNLTKNLTLKKITKMVFAIGALLGVLFGGSYHRLNGFSGILLGAIFWGVTTAFGFKGIFEFILNLVCKTAEEPETRDEAPAEGAAAEEPEK